MQQITGNTVIKNLVISDANNNDSDCFATIAGTLKNNGTLSFLQVSNSQITTTRESHHIGLVVEIMMDSSRIENTIVYSSSITANHSASLCGGLSGAMTDDTKSRNNTISFCNFTTYEHASSVGALSGISMDNVAIYENSVTQSHVIPHGNDAYGSLGTGRAYRNFKMKGCTFTDSSIETRGIHASTGFIAGATYWEGSSITISDTEVIRCYSLAIGESSVANTWVGLHFVKVQVNNSTAINCTSVDTQPVTQSTIIVPAVTVDNSTAINGTSVATQPVTQSTIIAPAVTVDDVSFVPILLYGGGAFVDITAIGLVSYLLFNGYQQDKSGWDLVKHPRQFFVKWFTNLYQNFSTSHSVQSEAIEMEEGEFDTENDEVNLLPSISILGSDNTVVLEEDQLL